MVLIEDSRQQAGKHEQKHVFFDTQCVPFIRCKLPVGDYALPPERAVDTKASMQEIAQNIGGTREEHERFRNELKLAQALGTKLYILVENTDGIKCIQDVVRWHNPRTEFSLKAIQGPQLAKAMVTMQSRYGCVFLFCRPEEAGEYIVRILRQ